MEVVFSEKDLQIFANTLRALSLDQVEAANSGHPGLPLGAADFASYLFCNILRFNPQDPKWAGRDRFVLSAGHGSALLYSLLAVFGYSDISIDDLKNFRRLGSKLAGHPENHLLDGVEATTGPLGQGVANSVGLALASKLLEARSGEAAKFRVFGLVSDGDLMEGISYEAASLAGHLGLDNLYLLYDDNKISLAGPTDVCFSEDVKKRFEAQGWIVFEADGHNFSCIQEAFDKAISSKEQKPRLIIFHTIIGYGSPKANSHEVHGSPLGKDATSQTKNNLGITWNQWEISQEVKNIVEQVRQRNLQGYNLKFKIGLERNSEELIISEDKLEHYYTAAEALSGKATRDIGGEVLNQMAKDYEWIVGGSADLEPSTKAYIKGGDDVSRENFGARNIRFGVREHAMAGIANGLALSGFFKPFVSTFLCFLDYLKPSLRLSCLSRLPVVYIFTHDSIFLGEDGPTHQPIEHLNHLRSIPNLLVFRPSCVAEVVVSYYLAFNQSQTPSAIILTRQPLKSLKFLFDLKSLFKGFWFVHEAKNPKLTIVASGSEVVLAYETVKEYFEDYVDLVSVFCFERATNLKAAIRTEKILLLEAASIPSFASKLELVNFMGMSRFGESGKDSDLARYFGFTKENLRKVIDSAL